MKVEEERELKPVIVCPECGTLQAPTYTDACQVCKFPFYLLKDDKYFLGGKNEGNR